MGLLLLTTNPQAVPTGARLQDLQEQAAADPDARPEFYTAGVDDDDAPLLVICNSELVSWRPPVAELQDMARDEVAAFQHSDRFLSRADRAKAMNDRWLAQLDRKERRARGRVQFSLGQAR